MSSGTGQPGNPPQNPFLFSSPSEKAQRVADNVVRQYDEVIRLVGLASGVLNITPDLLKNLQRAAIQNLYVCAGEFRTWDVYISNAPHQPPPWSQVPQLVDELCDYTNASTNRT